jgi:hypothetical protein
MPLAKSASARAVAKKSDASLIACLGADIFFPPFENWLGGLIARFCIH